MKILVLNAGSSSLKAKLYESKTLKCLFSDSVDRICVPGSACQTHEAGLKIILEKLIKQKIVKDLFEIKAIGHRVVHGGEKYTKSVLIDEKVIKEIQNLCTLAPLHNPPNLEGIRACKKLIPHAKQVAVFDTAFHQTAPEKAYLYGIPYEYYKNLGIRRYGFHGTSHKYVSEIVTKLTKNKNQKIISCHLGNGASVCAIKNEKSVDTSMGYTPLEGLMMGTRSGDLDPSIPLELCKKLNLSPAEVENILNKKSGLLAISGLSSDMRDLWKNHNKKMAKLAMTIYCYRIAKYIGSYAAAMNGLDSIIFTAGIGQNAAYIRSKVCSYLEFLGLKIDAKKNQKNSQLISSTKSKIKVFAIETNEELEIAKQTKSII